MPHPPSIRECVWARGRGGKTSNTNLGMALQEGGHNEGRPIDESIGAVGSSSRVRKVLPWVVQEIIVMCNCGCKCGCVWMDVNLLEVCGHVQMCVLVCAKEPVDVGALDMCVGWV